MLSRILSATTCGINATIVSVETHIEKHLPAFSIVGLPDSAVRESRERIIAAIRNSGFEFPVRKITVNLAPADIRKEGSSFDLPMAVGILTSTDQLAPSPAEGMVLVGELSLDGVLRPVRGVLPIAMEVRERGLRGMVVPRQNGEEAALVAEIAVFPVSSLAEAVEVLRKNGSAPPLKARGDLFVSGGAGFVADLSEVRGQENAKRALEVAAAGSHNLLMIGPPGSGKTMLARRIPGILPPLTREEALETTRVHSVAGLLPPGVPLVTCRPFRAPHHTISDAALVGGGSVPRPGEISLAHHGVLFLDEVPEFARNVLDVLRQPVEESRVTISRSRLTVEYPANFMLVCAMNPCPCGHATDPHRTCSCTPADVQKYHTRVSGPLLDRIDLHIEVPAVRYHDLASSRAGESSVAIRERVARARDVQARRFFLLKGVYANAGMQGEQIRRFCRLDAAGEELLKTAMSRLGLSARAYDRILKVSRTIADLAGSETIRPEHVGEAIQYRSLDRERFR